MRAFQALKTDPQPAYDAVVVGAGIGGLICANLLARARLRVLLVEQHYMTGGYCSTFRRKGFTFDAATHFYPLLGNPMTVTGSLLERLGSRTKWVKMDPVDHFHFPDGSSFSVSADFDEYLDELKATFPHEQESLEKFFALVPATILDSYMRITPRQVVEVWHDTVIGHLQANAIGFNAHYANGLSAMFIACGQDVANVANAAVGITDYEVTDEGDLYASVTLPALTVATVGGGTGLGTSAECLKMLGCAGSGHAPKLAEIVAATLLAGDLSMAAAIGSGEFVAAHETYGRNRPSAEGQR